MVKAEGQPEAVGHEDLFDSDTIEWVKASMDRQFQVMRTRYPEEDFEDYSGAWAHVRAEEFDGLIRGDLLSTWQVGADDGGVGDYTQSEWIDSMIGVARVGAVDYLHNQGELTPHGSACAGFVGWFIQGGWQATDEEIHKRLITADKANPFYGKMDKVAQDEWDKLTPEEQAEINQRVAQFMQRLAQVLW